MRWGLTLEQRRRAAIAQLTTWGSWQRRFAWWPTKMTDGSWLWLATYGIRVTPSCVASTLRWLEHTNQPWLTIYALEWEVLPADDLVAFYGVNINHPGA